jgi:hypothetical protein
MAMAPGMGMGGMSAPAMRPMGGGAPMPPMGASMYGGGMSMQQPQPGMGLGAPMGQMPSMLPSQVGYGAPAPGYGGPVQGGYPNMQYAPQGPGGYHPQPARGGY